MRAASEELKELMETQRPFTYAATITLTDGTEIELSESEMSAQGCRITWSAGSSSFPVGYAISKCLTLGFFNFGDQYIDYDFFGATVEMSASVQLSQNVETIDLDTYTITEPEEYGTTITIVGYDAMCRADIPYNSELSFPASLQSIFREVCDMIDLLPMTTNFSNNSFVVDEKPEELSCRQVLGYIAQLAGGNAIVRGSGVYILPYGSYSFSTAQSLHEVISQNISTDDVVITGVTLRSEDDEVSAGNSGYMLSFENPLTKGNEATAVNLLADLYVGLTFRPFEQKTMSYPLAEFGDTCTVYRGGEPHGSYITDIDFDFRGTTTLKCSADSPVRNAGKSQQGSATIRELKKLIRQEKTTREIAEADLAQRIASTKGMYQTIEQTQEGSIYYLHDKPELSNSQIIWKMTSEAMAVSTNGGQTWNAGLTVDGVLLAKILSTEGVDAEWINTGSFVVKDQGGDTVFLADVDTGRVLISGDKVFIGDVSIADMISDMTGALTVSLSNEMQAIPVAHDGSYDTFPQISTTVQVFASGQDVTDSCVITYSEFNVTGNYTQHVYTPFSLSADTGYVTFSARYSTSGQTLTASRKFSLYKSYAGETGADGKARLYFLDSNADVIKQGADGSFTPPEIVFTANYRDSNEELRHPYSGLFKVEVTEDGSTWTVVEQPGTNKQSTTYTPTDGIQAVRCYLYSTAEFDEEIYGLGTGDEATILTDSDGVWLEARREGTIVEGGNLLDIQTSPVVHDVSSLTQDDVFNILTNGGQSQGLYLSNGKLYINAEYIATGILRSKPVNGVSTTYWNLDTGELVINPAAKIGSGGESLTSVQARITTTQSGLTSEITARRNADTELDSRITQNADAIELEVSERQGDTSSLSSRITQNAKSITSEVSNRKSAISSLSSRITQTENSISAEITNRENGQTTLGTRITATERGISTEVSNRKTAISGVYSRITQTEGKITAEVTDRENADAGLRSRITATENAITTKVTMGEVESKITQSASTIRLKASTIKWSSDNSSMTEAGVLTATGANITGKITSTSGKIGGFVIDENSIRHGALTSTSGGAVALANADFTRSINGTSRSNLRFAIGSKLGIANDGTVYATGADITGKITASSGEIGGFLIGSYSIQSGTLASTDDGAVALTNSNFTRAINGTNRSYLRLAIGGNFAVSRAGTLYAAGANVSGNITASGGTIGGFTIGDTFIRSGGLTSTAAGSVGLSTETFTRTINGTSRANLKFAIGANFGVDQNGNLYASGTLDGATVSGGDIIAQNPSGHLRTRANNATYAFQHKDLKDTYVTESDFSKDMFNDTSMSDSWFSNTWSSVGSISMSSYNCYDSGYKPVSQYRSGDDGFITSQSPFMVMSSGTGLSLRIGGTDQVMLTSGALDINSTNTYAKTIRATRLYLSGDKSRVAETDDYGKRLLYCYEMPSPMFGDIGEGVIGDDGKCYVTIDPTFSETIQTTQYQVFLQMYGEGTAYVAERKPGYFIVCGTPGLSFGWEMKAKQKGFENRRLDSDNGDTDIDSLDYGVAAKQHIDSVLAERSIA